MKNVLFALPCFLLLFASVVTAQPRARRLDYRAPPECPDGSRFADEVAVRVGFLPFVAAADVATTVRIWRDASGPTVEFVGTLGMDVDGEPTGGVTAQISWQRWRQPRRWHSTHR